ncbi:hypothetical protein C942_01390 [Photobacterium marinum]|uniref:Uncharacterized protein n=1 Tax=Photobacterium marinum TaxID=1056511 RepID=L8JF17_9GAMM|nr:hypothetical protein C942_01390 [Photobacterium marinum]
MLGLACQAQQITPPAEGSATTKKRKRRVDDEFAVPCKYPVIEAITG